MSKLPSWMLAIAAALLVFAWQWTTVTANYGGNWTAVFCSSASQPTPPELAGESIYRFPGPGYDGQSYHYMAHDPLLRSTASDSFDNQRFRYRRILMPALANLAAFGRTEWVDRAYEFVFLLFVALGVWWSCEFVRRAGASPAWGLLFLAVPAVPIAADRMVVDIALAALTVAFLLYAPASSWKLFAVLACAALTRETGLLLIAGYGAWLLLRRDWRNAILCGLSSVPALGWYAYVQSRTTASGAEMKLAPFRSLIDAALHPLPYPPGIPLVAWVQFADYVALAGLCIALALAVWRFRNLDAAGITGAFFVLTAVLLQDPNPFHHVYDYGRVYSPLLLLLAAGAIRNHRFLLLPALLMLPRIAIQLTPQILGVLR